MTGREPAVGFAASRARTDVVNRPSLFGRLGQASRITQVSGPAGSGKTFLVRAWVADAGIADSTAWLTVDRRERDPLAFWLCVLDALRATPAGSKLVRDLTAIPGLDAWSLVERLLDDLAPLEAPLWLVIDDLDDLESDDALKQLAELLRRAPEQLRLVLLARRDLPLGLHRLRLEGELTEIRGADLPFSLEEARALFEASGLDLSGGALEQLVARTEGWVAGLRLAALSLAGNPDPERFAADFSGSERTVAEYLLAEVLGRQPPEVTQVLLRTSILARVTGPLADRLTGGSGGQQILDALESAGAFVVSLDPQRTWYRYHHLFADLLTLELRRTEPTGLPKLHTTAAEWLAEHGQPVEAIRHAQAAENWRLATTVLTANWFGLYLDGRQATSHELLAGFPPEVIAREAELAVIAAGDQLSSDSLDGAQRYLEQATAAADDSVDEHSRARFEITLAILRLVLARGRNDGGAAAREAEQLMLYADSASLPPGFSEDLRAIALVNLGAAEVWTGRPADAERHLEQAGALARRIGRPLLEVQALAQQAFAAALRSPARGKAHAYQAIELGRAHGWSEESFVGVAYTVLGAVTLWEGQLGEAEQWIAWAENTLRADVERATAVVLYRSRGLIELLSGRYEEALAAFNRMAPLRDVLNRHLLGQSFEAQALIAQFCAGEVGQVQAALAELDDDARDMVGMRLVAALIALHDDRPEVAAAELEVVLNGSETSSIDVRWTLQGLLVGALALDALRDAGGASRALERALDLAEPDGLLLPFLLFPAGDLLERHVRLGTAHASLVSEILILLSGRPLSSPEPAPQSLHDPLSDSELRVLRYLPTNLQAPEIAAELFVSVSTVRTHIQHIYSKLGVHRRAEAVERARQLGLLAPTGRR